MPSGIERRFAPCPFCTKPVRVVFQACPHCGRRVRSLPAAVEKDTLDCYDLILWHERPELKPPEVSWPPVNSVTGERSPAYREAPCIPFQCSKAELLRALGKSASYTSYLDALVNAGKLKLDSAKEPVGYSRYLATFTEPAEHARVRAHIEQERRQDGA
jgi:hypothetical protein